MKLSGPCFVLVHNGQPLNKWQVNKSFTRNHEITTESYYLNTKEDAEIFYSYLQQEIAREDLEKTIKSNKTYQWEKRELIEFKKTLDFSFLENKIKGMEYIKEINRCTIRRNKK